MISILIPTYNEKVDQLVNVLHAQAEKLSIEFEILVYDDGSTTRYSENEAINMLTHTSYRYFEENIGRGAIRNKLANNAKAEVLLFLDADVLPTKDDFLSQYELLLNDTFDLICGGVVYKREKVPVEERLRHAYGKKREEKTAKTRQQNPYFIVSANLLIRKACFFEINTELQNLYGGDLFLSQNLKHKQRNVQHIDNPVWHLGLESSSQFIKKSEAAIRNLVRWEREGALDANFTPLQQKYLSFKRKGILPLYQFLMKMAYKVYIANNLTSKNPSPLLFNMYRLYYYSLQKKHA